MHARYMGRPGSFAFASPRTTVFSALADFFRNEQAHVQNPPFNPLPFQLRLRFNSGYLEPRTIIQVGEKIYISC